MNEIVPILLAGGSGTRLWPLSRESYPKQFLKLIGDRSLFQETAIRLTTTKDIEFKPHITLTNSNFRFIAAQQLLDIGLELGPIIIEPEVKNTAPAILSAVMYAHKQNKEAVIIVAPSDHIITSNELFHKTLNSALKDINKGRIITFGVKPSRPETGYGYLELEKRINGEMINLVRFIEKPNEEDANKMFNEGNFLWNSGIFLFRSKDMLMAFRKYAPKMFYNVNEALEESKIDLDFLRLEPKSWSKCENISLDYAIMEKIKNISVFPFNGKWSDLGDWEAVWEEMKPNKDGVSLSKNAHEINCKNSLLRSENKNQEIVGIGLNNIIGIAMPDAVLVANKNQTQHIKKIVKDLKEKKITQADTHTKSFRPWGWFESLTTSDNFQVKIIHVNPDSSLSLQSHNYRSEHWVIVKGTPIITIGKEIKSIHEGESIFVPKGVKHRIENKEKIPNILIEVQIGSYLGEDDIIRYDDIYSRN